MKTFKIKNGKSTENNKEKSKTKKKRLLLTSVFGPFGVDNEYGEKSNKMELFHNQVTREQGIFSYRFNHNSFGLYFLAENINVPSTVLDFPSLDDFKRELNKGYEYIGISFIIPNLKKAQKMTQLIRKLSPESKIILGGHGTNTPNVENLLEYDYISRGEGISFLRELFNEDTDAPIKHPLVRGSCNRKIMGVKLPLNTGMVVTGVGCANKCPFCATSHFFREYTAYLPTGKDIFDLCCRYEDEMGVSDFSIMDENFLKMKDRALELISLMEENERYFTFSIFSSAETMKKLGDLDLLIRLGVQFIWIGIESKEVIFEKNRDTDFNSLFRELQKRGIPILASAILFLEHHDKTTIHDDINWAIDLAPDYLQFMQLGPIPGTALYEDYDKKGLILEDVPYMEQHGQDKIWFKHKYFTREESHDYLKMAFQRDYQKNGASLLRYIKTFLQGDKYMENHSNYHIRNRRKYMQKMIREMRYMLPACKVMSENRKTDHLINEVSKTFNERYGRSGPLTWAMSAAVLGFAFKEKLLNKYTANTKQPSVKITRYHQDKVANSNDANKTQTETQKLFETEISANAKNG